MCVCVCLDRVGVRTHAFMDENEYIMIPQPSKSQTVCACVGLDCVRVCVHMCMDAK